MSFMDKLRKSVDDAVEKARPMVEDAAKKAKPMVETAVEKSRTALAENSDKVNTAIDVAAKQADRRTRGKYSDQISNLTRTAKREVGDLEQEGAPTATDGPAAAPGPVSPEPELPDAEVVDGTEPPA